MIWEKFHLSLLNTIYNIIVWWCNGSTRSFEVFGQGSNPCQTTKNMNIGIVSGYFNPIHYGHIEYINGAKKHSDKLIVIINSDFQRKLKGSKEFMDEDHRLKIVSNLKSVDDVIISIDKDKTQCETLKYLKSLYPKDDVSFFNSGDRQGENLVTAESQVCKDYNINEEVLVLPKIHSSSELLKKL